MSRTVKEALRIAKNPLRLHQMIARHGYDDGGDVSTGEPMTVPERPETIGMQMRQLVLGKRAGVFVAKGTKGVTVPDGMRVVRTQEGNIVFDPEAISKEEIEEAVQDGRLNEVLGYVQSKDDAIEESLENGEMPNFVVSRDGNGIEQDAAVVSPDRAEEQAEIFSDRARGGSTVSIEDLNSPVVRDRLADGGSPAPYGVVDLGDKIIVGSPHGEQVELSDELKRRVQDVAKKHGAWYEGTGGDIEPNKELVPEYHGSWDDAYASSVKGYPTEYLAPMFSNVDVNKPHEMFEDPKRTIMASLIANQDKMKYFKDRRYDEKALRDFLKQGSEGDVDFLKMSQMPATKENLSKFFKTGESLAWPENWQEYPHNLGKMAKKTEEGRNKYLLDAPPGVYFTGAGHIPELRSLKKDLNVIGGERSAMADGGVPDDDSQEAFLKKELEGSAPQYDPEAGMLTGKRAGLLAAGFAPGSGIASAAGKFPTAEGGFEPSAKEDWKAGNYGSALMKVAGAAGDVAQAVPVVGTAAGAALKAPLAFKLASAMAPAAKIAREAAPVAKAAEEAAGAAKVAEEAKPAYQRLVNPAGFYSRAHEAAMTELPEGERTWQEMHSLLSKAPRVQKEELHWSGIHPETFDPKQKVTREQIGEMIEKNFPKVSPIQKGGELPKALSPEEATEHVNRLKAAGLDVTHENGQWHVSDPQTGYAAPAVRAASNSEYPEHIRGIISELVAPEHTTMRPMHETYTVPGGENYNERILTHEYNDPNRSYVDPEVESKYADEMSRLKEQRSALLQEQKDLFENNPAADPDIMIRKINANTEDMRDLQRKIKEESRARLPETPAYTQNKFRHEAHLGDINNPILHTRNSERTIPGRGKVWHQEEVQSDWAQQGREKGFKQPMSAADRKEMNELDDVHNRTPEQKARLAELRELEAAERASGSIPQAPHVRDTEHWLDLAAKDTLKNAIEGGHDHIFITGGQEQAKRWSNELRKAVDNVRWETPNAEKTQQAIEAATKQRAAVRDQFSDTVFGKPYSELTETAKQNIDKMMRQAGKDVTIPEAVRSGASAGVKDQYANYFHNKPYSELTPEQRTLVDKELIASGHGPEDYKVVYARPVGSDTEHRFVVKQVEGPNGKPRVEVVDSAIPSARGETLSAVLGNDMAKRIMAEESGEQAMNGYRMGSEGYSQTYERKYPSSFKKLLKSLDPEAKIEAGHIEAPGGKPSKYIGVETSLREVNDVLDNEALEPEVQQALKRVRNSMSGGDSFHDAMLEYGTPEVAELFGGELKSGTTPAHGTWITITPKMRAEYNRLKKQHGSVFPAYERGGRVSETGKQEYSKTNWHYPRKSIQGALAIARKVTDR